MKYINFEVNMWLEYINKSFKGFNFKVYTALVSYVQTYHIF